MAYVKLQIPPNTPSEIGSIVRGSFDMYFEDVHTMLQLPMPNTEASAGCNFPVALTLFAVVSAVSRVIYPLESPDGGGFKQLLGEKFPWDAEPPGGLRDGAAADYLYDEFRNPLAHTAGLAIRPAPAKAPHRYIFYSPATHRRVQKSRGPAELEVARIEASEVRPEGWPPTLALDSSDAPPMMEFFLEGLYWGIRRMITNLCGDTTIMKDAVANLARMRQDQMNSVFSNRTV